jgi:6-phosphofructokinase 1
MGVAAIDALLDDQQSIMIGLVKNDRIVHVPFSKAVKLDHSIDQDLLDILRVINI